MRYSINHYYTMWSLISLNSNPIIRYNFIQKENAHVSSTRTRKHWGIRETGGAAGKRPPKWAGAFAQGNYRQLRVSAAGPARQEVLLLVSSSPRGIQLPPHTPLSLRARPQLRRRTMILIRLFHSYRPPFCLPFARVFAEFRWCGWLVGASKL